MQENNREQFSIINIDETDEEKKLGDRELKKVCKKYAQDNFQGEKFVNIDTGKEILVSRDGLDKWDFITKSREQSISIKKLNIIIEQMKKTSSKNDKKNRKFVDGFTYFDCPISVNKKTFIANIATRETNGKDSKYYYHFLRDM